MALLKAISGTNFAWRYQKNLIQKQSKNKPRYFTTIFSVPKISKKKERWDEVIQEAEELVKHGKTDASGIIGQADNGLHQLLIQFLGWDNPIFNSARQLLCNSEMNYQLHGLVSLLVAKTAGHVSNSPHYEECLKHDGISPKQYKLADVLNLSRASFIFHTNVLNLSRQTNGKIIKNLQRSNGVCVLLGDYLAANASTIMGSIRENEVLSSISKGIIDNTEYIFVGDTDKNGNFLPSRAHPPKLWEERMFLGHASLLANGCDAVVSLGGHNVNLRTKAFNFAKHFMLALQINEDLNSFKEISKYKIGTPFSLDLGPVIMHLDRDPELLSYILLHGNEDIENLDFTKIYSAVQNGDGEKKSFLLLKSHVTQALTSLSDFSKESKAKYLLQDMLETLRMD